MLKSKITLYVPSTRNGGDPLTAEEHQRIVTEVSKQFAKKFGGYTCQKGVGGWITEDNQLIEESVTLVTSYHAIGTRDALAFVIPIAQAIKFRYGQEAVSVETEQGIEFI